MHNTWPYNNPCGYLSYKTSTCPMNYPAYPGRLLKRGSKGSSVEKIQRRLGVCPITGVFGVKTEQSVKDYQYTHGLDIDGIVGPATWNSLFRAESNMTDYFFIFPALRSFNGSEN